MSRNEMSEKNGKFFLKFLWDGFYFKDFLHEAKYYFFYCFLTITFFYTQISLVVFIHFLLGQHFSIIDNWIYRNCFELIFISKIFSLFIVIKFLDIYSLDKKSIFSFVKKLPIKFDLSIVVVTVYLYILLFVSFKINYVWDEKVIINLSPIFSGLWGNLFFYLCDFFLLACLKEVIPNVSRNIFINTAIYLTCFILTTRLIIPYKITLPLHVFLHLLVMFVIYLKTHKQLIDILFYLFFIVLPIETFFGMNLIWGKQYSPFVINNLSSSKIVLIWFFAIFYLMIKRKKVS